MSSAAPSREGRWDGTADYRGGLPARRGARTLRPERALCRSARVARWRRVLSDLRVYVRASRDVLAAAKPSAPDSLRIDHAGDRASSRRPARLARALVDRLVDYDAVDARRSTDPRWHRTFLLDGDAVATSATAVGPGACAVRHGNGRARPQDGGLER